MNEKNAEFEPLPCNAIIYRALLRKQWIESETDRIKPNAYFLRKNKEERSLFLKKINEDDRNRSLFPMPTHQIFQQALFIFC